MAVHCSLSHAPITFLSSPCRYLQVGQAKPRPSVNNQASTPLASGDLSTAAEAVCLCDSPEGSCPTRRGTGLSRCCPAPGEGLSAAPAAGEQRRGGRSLQPLSPGARGDRDTTPPDRGLQWTPRSAARPCPGRRNTSGPSRAGSPLPAARRSLPPRRAARGPRARREKSAATPQRPSPRGAAGGIGPRFPGLSLRAARGDRGLQRPARPRPQVASFPCRPSEPGGGEAGRGTCAKRCWGGGRRPGGRRAPQPLPGWGCRAFPVLGVAADVKPSPPSYLTASPTPMAPSAPGRQEREPEAKNHHHKYIPLFHKRALQEDGGGTKQNPTPLSQKKMGWGWPQSDQSLD